MPATITTEEHFEKTVTEEEMEEARRLRILAGAIRSWVDERDEEWVLYTEWNVIGGQ